MILGSRCTRNCRFCVVEKGKPEEVDINEPKNVATAAKTLGLQHIVVTSVTRDDLTDGGAGHFAAVIQRLREALPKSTIEVLIPDFKGDASALNTVIEARPDIINHNIETVADLYSEVRPMADYKQSLTLLARVKNMGDGIISKTGIMVGLGETEAQVLRAMEDLVGVGCDILTIGQYMRPTPAHIRVAEYVHPDQFEKYREIALKKGFKFVASGPFVRSSYHAAEAMRAMEDGNGLSEK